MWEHGIISKLVATVKVEKSQAITLASIRIISELCKSNVKRVKQILQDLGIPWFLDVINSNVEEHVNAVQYCLQVWDLFSPIEIYLSDIPRLNQILFSRPF